MSSVGQAVGGVVGAVVGFFTPLGPLYGAQLGMMAGGYLDPPKGPHSYGPRLDDLSVQTSTYGAFIPRVYGHAPIVGNIIWLENNKLREVSKTESEGGKGGGGGSEVTTYSYYATFAVGICHGPISAVRRIWIGNKLFYDAGSSDEGTVRQGGENAKYFTVHTGSETQQPDDRMEATLGVGNVPAYRGLAYIVFKDLPLKDYGNSLMAAQVKVEVCHAVDPVSFALSGHSNAWAIPYYGSNTGYNARALQNPCDSRGLQNIFQRVSYTDYAVQQVNRSGKSTWYHGGVWTGSTTLYGFSGKANLNDASFAYIDMASAQPWIGYLSNNKMIRFQCPIIPGGALYGNAQFAESNGAVWVRLQDKMWNATSGVVDLGSASDTSAYVRAGNLFLAGIPAMPEGSLSSALNYIEHDDTGAVVRSGAIPFTQTSVAARRSGLAAGGSNNMGGCVDERYFYFSYLSDQATGGGDCSVVCMVFDIIDNTFVREVNLPCTMGAGTPAFSLMAAGNLQCSVHGRVVYAQWEEDDDYSKVHYLSFAPLQFNAQSTTLGGIVGTEVLRSNILSASDIDVTSLTDAVRGYRVSNNGSIRSAIEPLTAAFPFDVIQSGYKVKFIRRGGSALVATIPASDFDARAMDSASGFSISDVREMDTQLPCRVVVNYLDESREYDTGSQYAARINTDAVNVEQLDLPIVMIADEAAQAAEVLLYMRWLDRNTVSFRLPPTYAHLEPVDIVTVETETRSYTLRLTQVSYLPDGRLECQAKPYLNTTYTSAAKGQSGNLPGSVIPFRGPSYYALIDCACLKDAMNTPGFLAVMGGVYDSWAGGTIVRSTDVGATWNPVMSFSVESTTGICAAPLGAAASDCIDAKSTLSVVMQAGALASVTRDQMLNGANHFAYGAPGRWEIIAAQNCTLQSDGGYILRDLLRGRFGTEHHTGSHSDGDTLVVLGDLGTPFFPVSSSTIGAAYLYKGITSGAAIDSDSAAEFAYVGENLKPLSPVFLNAARDVASHWNIAWVRRTRIDGEWRDLIDVPVGEVSESYEIDIYGSSAFSAVKRTLTATTNAAQYTLAQQIADFGSDRTTLYAAVYQKSAAVGRGNGVRGTFSVPPNAVINDLFWSSVSLLLHFNGTGGSTTFTDQTGKTVTPTNASLSTTSPKFGTACGAFNGTNASLAVANNAAFQFGSGDFTVEFYCRNNEIAATKFFALFGAAGALSWWIYRSAQQVYAAASADGTNNAVLISSGNVITSTSAWYHVAFVRRGNAFTLYVDGLVVGTASFSGSLFATTSPLSVGQYGGGFFFNGSLDELRVTKGVARYIGEFTPPASEFPNQ